MDVPVRIGRIRLQVLVLELDENLVRVRDYEQVQAEGEYGYDGRRDYVRHHHPVETDAAGEYGYDFGISGHLRGEENHRDEYEQCAEHIHEIRDEIEVIVEDDGFQRRFLAHKVIDFLAYVENDDYADDQNQCHEESRDELLDYV